MSELFFPDGFIWGTATSAYQIEGGYNEDGKGESIWDRYTHTKGTILNNNTGDTACDHYHLFEKDVKILKELGIKSYRFSISWTRIFPDGMGKPNKKGIEFYHNLVKLLADNGITPAVTLYHWDLPQKLQDIGGWANREVPGLFEKYARYIFEELGEKVPIWITFNEPWVSSFIGYWYGGHPPAVTNLSSALQAAHNIMLAHGMTVRTFRKMGMKGEIGISLNLNPVYPASEDENDFVAAKRYSDFLNGWFLDPILKGKYPQQLLELFSNITTLPEINSTDMDIIHTPIDFLGINNYSLSSIVYDPEKLPFQLNFADTGKARTDTGWEIFPEGIYDLLLYLNNEYNGIKIIITENGAAFKDVVGNDGKVNDDDRIGYLNDHIIQVYQAIRDGVNLAGYYIWSFMDNFEWKLGYSKRFGLVYIDYETQNRIIKKSGYWYRKVIENNGIA
jgi:beta-glucosidase